VSLSKEQISELLKPIDPARVGKDGKGFSHVEAWDIRRTMNRIFGFGGWSADVGKMELVAEREVQTRQGKPAWNVVYRAQCVLRLGDAFGDGYATYTEWAAGDATNPTLADAHDQAIKTAESQAFKRCAVNLGDQFGLSLYKDGSLEATVGDVVGREYADSERVDHWLAGFSVATSEDQVATIALEIRGADIAAVDRNILLKAYGDAQKRVKAAG